MRRRTALKIVTLGALTTRLGVNGELCFALPDDIAAWAAGNYQLAFFTAAENELLDQAMEFIIPADSHSGGAHSARVSLFADRIVSGGNDTYKAEWRSGVQLFRAEAAKSSVADALARAAAGEANPQTDLERFFHTLKQMTATGYYSSEIGIHQEMEYQGNTYVAEYPGCPKD